MELRQEIAAKQQTALSPRLYQSMKILRLEAGDLLDLIQKELEENPALEMPEPSDLDPRDADSSERRLWEEYLRANGPAPARAAKDRTVNATDLAASPVSLADHLNLQLDMEDLSPLHQRVGMAIIGSLDQDGYLRDPVDCIARTTDAAPEDVEAVLAIIQLFDPPGVAARSIEECLVIQLRQAGGNSVAEGIVVDFLPELARNAYAEIGRKLSVSAARAAEAAGVIRELNPAPGSLFDSNPPAAAVIPDVFTFRSGDEVRIIANNEMLPPLKLNEAYREAARGDDGTSEETALYLKQKIQEASRLVRDVKHRGKTISKVASAIVAEQPDFFLKGPAHLRPLSVEAVAKNLDIHASTVSRAILGKYMNTPFGIYEFRYFFSAGYSTGGGKQLAANAVKKRLCQIVKEEDPRKPLSDQKLVESLLREEISISRRTIAKYRDELGILPSWQRKKGVDCWTQES